MGYILHGHVILMLFATLLPSFTDTKTCKHEVMRGNSEEQDHWKKFIFDSEQIITSMKISVTPFAIQGLPAFIIAYSRTCNFRGIGADFLMYNGTKRVRCGQCQILVCRSACIDRTFYSEV